MGCVGAQRRPHGASVLLPKADTPIIDHGQGWISFPLDRHRREYTLVGDRSTRPVAVVTVETPHPFGRTPPGWMVTPHPVGEKLFRYWWVNLQPKVDIEEGVGFFQR
jgi:hypothetical protein